MKPPAIVTLTPHGTGWGRRLLRVLADGEVIQITESLKDHLQQLYQAGRPLICVMALGIVVRVLGPLTGNKQDEPPVVVVDEGGRFAISVLGGHGAGANDLARRVADALGATPVITTASDSLELPAVDLIGRGWGWKIEDAKPLKAVAAAVIRGEPIGVFQQTGRPDWYESFGAWPGHFHRLSAWPAEGNWAGVLLMGDLKFTDVDRYPTLVYRPPSLVLGIGCRRGVVCAEVEAMFDDLCRRHYYSSLSLGMLATICLKANESALLEFAEKYNVPLRSYSLEEIGQVQNLPTPSRAVMDKVGVWGVAEPAAMLAAGTNELLVPKQRGKRITMALGRRENV